MLLGQFAELADRGLQELGVGREGNVLGLHRGVHRDAGQVALLQGAGVVGDAQAFGQENVQPIADAFAPMTHAGALMGQLVLEKLFASEVLEIGILHPTVPDLLVREVVGVFQHEHADHEAHRLRRAALVGKTPCQLLVEPGPVDLSRQRDKFVLHVDDLIEAGPEKVVVTRFLLLFRSHKNPRFMSFQGITNGPKKESQIARKSPPEP